MLDVQGLPEDRVYFTEVENFMYRELRKKKHSQIIAYDSENSEFGAVFRVPVTVIKPRASVDPHSVVESSGDGELMLPAQPLRHFVHVPDGCEYAGWCKFKSCKSFISSHSARPPK
jgi:hypothetical protein